MAYAEFLMSSAHKHTRHLKLDEPWASYEGGFRKIPFKLVL
jgi:hypothetical protein